MASYIPDLTRDNISLYTIPAVWYISLQARTWARGQYKKAANKDIDIRYPRGFSKSISEDPALDEHTRGRMIRAEAATANGLENLSLFAAAVVAGSAARVDAKWMNSLSLMYVTSRVVYNFVYINDVAYGRLASYLGGLGMCFTLFIKAARKFAESQ